MCEKQKRIEELEKENAELYQTLSNTYKLNAEGRKFEAEREKLNAEEQKFEAERERLLIDTMKMVRDIKYQPILLITPLVVSLIALVAAIAK
ncbi:hypothetical protein AB4562_05715 [Vibrio sp. 10N.222.54.A1]|uniref:Uncharacterized protein n=1 Tax=Vibrio tasmaniensis TaxID=212663 RepID=A0A0H3ZXF2_9VIBR|nr:MULTISPECIES: hypothetical protein [Vibrio]AKN39242.1 hypothetical protein [Vibrio tasmaniensis]CAK3356878.1 conserved hypothetical protein [Vibrio crassostreae]MCG9692841.1 hypothetical protein [Vibrio sp. Isolate22]PMJ43114.1 hypothetical protein BCU24_00655 [Vibrio cyclitrophicus]TKE80004.1 hypothetical protein FCV54_14795 [Vibrio sp. F12]